MDQFPGNQHRHPESTTRKTESITKAVEDKKIEPVTSDVVRIKKPLGKKFMETFFGGDAKSTASGVFADVVVPATKDLIADMFIQAIERMIFGEATGRSRSRDRGRSSGGFFNYNRASTERRPREERREVSRRARETHDFGEIGFRTRMEAKETLDRMYDLLERYETVSVADFLSLTDSKTEFTDDKWGWTTLQGTDIYRTRDGLYVIDFPKPVELE